MKNKLSKTTEFNYYSACLSVLFDGLTMLLYIHKIYIFLHINKITNRVIIETFT